MIGLVNLLVSLDQGHWSYPEENFVGWVTIASLRFTIEELVLWIILGHSAFIKTQKQSESYGNSIKATLNLVAKNLTHSL